MLKNLEPTNITKQLLHNYFYNYAKVIEQRYNSISFDNLSFYLAPLYVEKVSHLWSKIEDESVFTKFNYQQIIHNEQFIEKSLNIHSPHIHFDFEVKDKEKNIQVKFLSKNESLFLLEYRDFNANIYFILSPHHTQEELIKHINDYWELLRCLALI